MKVGVIGGGPSGMMAAIKASQGGNQVVLLEKNNKLGKKLFITGKGRCNLCNDCDDEDFFNQIVSNPSFMYSSYYAFPPHSLMNFFEDRQTPLKVERGKRVFPRSDKSSDIIRALEKELIKNQVEIHYNCEVQSIYKDGIFYVKTSSQSFSFDKIIIATGGFTYPACGSTGQGYNFAKRLGHTIVEPKAGLVGLRTNHKGKKDLVGLSLKNIEIFAKKDRKKIKIFGDLLFTHYGVSGPSVLSLSSYINRWDRCEVFIDFKPAVSKEKLDQRLIREFKESPNKGLEKILENLSPKSLVPILLEESSIDGKTKAHQITKEERRFLVNLYKEFPLHYRSLFEESTGIISSGGVDVKEINPSTMESKLCKGLYFAGEIIDVDALTGGYNLQVAFSTGYLAGLSMGEHL